MNRDQYEREIIVRLFQTANALQTYLDKSLQPDQLTAKQFFMMIVIGAFEYEPRIGEIADAFGTSHQNTKQILLKLQKQGYIRLYKDENDSRILRTSFTDKAMTYWQQRDQGDIAIIKEIFALITDQDLSVLLDGLMKTKSQIEGLTEHMEERRES